MKKLFVLIILIYVFNQIVLATPQTRDILYWHGEKYHVFPFIDIERRLNSVETYNLNKIKTANPPTSNYRGYLFEFEITNDSLYLLSVKDSKHLDQTEQVFGDHTRKYLSDFSDTLYLGYGSSFHDDAFWTLIYENELTVVFKNGIVQWTKDNKGKSRYSPYSNDLNKLIEFIYFNIQWNNLNKDVLQKKPRVFAIVETDSIAKIEKIKITRSSGYAEFDEEAIRVLKTIPFVSVSFVCGKYIPHKLTYCIDFDIDKAKKMGVNTVSIIPTYYYKCNYF